MTTAISPMISPLPPISTELGSGTAIGAVPSTGAPSFESRVGDAIGEVQRLQDNAAGAAESYMRGEHQDVHGTMIAMQEADVSLRLMTSVRNRAIEAYREIMRMGS